MKLNRDFIAYDIGEIRFDLYRHLGFSDWLEVFEFGCLLNKEIPLTVLHELYENEIRDYFRSNRGKKMAKLEKQLIKTRN